MYIPNPSTINRIWHKVNLSVELNRFKFRVFLLRDQLPYQCKRTQTALLFTFSWMHTFPKGIKTVKCKKPCPGFELK